jgi:thiamine-monophosphate kinase
MSILDPDEMPPWLATVWPPRNGVSAGINDDDCAVLELSGRHLVVTTDFLNASPIVVQLRLGEYFELGRLVVASNVADLISTGVRPEGLLIGAMLPRGTAREAFVQLIEGVAYEVERWSTTVVGGDTKLGDSLALYGTAFGSTESPQHLLLKCRAQPGDLLFVSGPIGSCNAAVLGLQSGVDQDRLSSWCREAITEPQLPLEAMVNIGSSGLAHAGFDLSDGLGADLEKLCVASGVGVVLRASAIPVAENAQIIAKALGVPSWALAFGGGGDFQIVISAPADSAGSIRASGFHEIGYLTSDRELCLELSNGERRPLPRLGHRDVRGGDFRSEVEELVRRAAGRA